MQERKYRSISEELREHFDVLGGKIEDRAIRKMGTVCFTNKEVKDQLKKMKSNKQSGPDGIKAEMWKWLGENKKTVEMLTKSLNKIIQEENIPESWKTSKTVLIPKNAKPKIKDFRPTALTNSGYKLYMSLPKEKIIEHLTVKWRSK